MSTSDFASKRRRLPPLNALKAFESAARLGGFTAAAEELFVSPGAISRHVANLESFLGHSLFKRGHNEVRLTNAGAAYLTKVQEALDTLEEASRIRDSAARTQKLHVMALPTFTERWLLPRLPTFLGKHPEANVQLSTSMEEIDWDTGRADVAVYAVLDGTVDRGRPLFSTNLVPVSSPDWAAANGMAICPSELQAGPMLASTNRMGDWLRWLHAAGVAADSAVPSLTFGNSTLAYHAASAGLGAVCAERELIARDIEAGRLVPLSDITIPGGTYFVESRPNLRHGDLAQAFVAWLVAQSTAANT